MGPITLFDKSFLQSLSLDESVWFDHFFYPVICPLFYIETLADLEKAVRQGRTPEQEVGIIADKVPELGGGPCIHHATLLMGNLNGYSLPMNGRIPVAGGRPVKKDEKRGWVFDSSPEAEAFKRWQEGKFMEVERLFAQSWRATLNSIDLLAIASAMRALGIDSKKCRTLQEAKNLADAIVMATDKPFDRMKFALLLLNIPHFRQQHILKLWQDTGSRPITEFAPYAAYVLTVELFFQIELAANLISSERVSNRVDIAYLFYLPFCMVFVSFDKLHRKCVPLFLRPNQTFIWGEDLKAHLSKLNEHYLALPETDKEEGIFKFASTPPGSEGCLVSELWDRHLRPWRKRALEIKIKDSDQEKKLVKEMSELCKAPTVPAEELNFKMDEAEMSFMISEPNIRKGFWCARKSCPALL